MSNPKEKTENEDSKVSNASGLTGGTAIAFFANSLPENTWYKQFLVVISPILTVIISRVVKYANKKIREQRLENSYNKTRDKLQNFINDSNKSDEDKKKYKIALEKLDYCFVQGMLSEIESLSNIDNISLDS